MELVWISLLLPTTYVALGKILDFSEFFFLICKIGITKVYFPNILWSREKINRVGENEVVCKEQIVKEALGEGAEPCYWWTARKTLEHHLLSSLTLPQVASLLALKEQVFLKSWPLLKMFSSTIPPPSKAWFFSFSWVISLLKRCSLIYFYIIDNQSSCVLNVSLGLDSLVGLVL